MSKKVIICIFFVTLCLIQQACFKPLCNNNRWSKEYQNLIDNEKKEIDTNLLLKQIQVYGEVYVDSFFIIYNPKWQGWDGAKYEKCIDVKNLTESDIYYLNFLPPIDTSVFLKKNRKNFRFNIFDKNSFVLAIVQGFLKKNILPFISDTVLKEKMFSIVANNQSLPCCVKKRKINYLDKRRYRYDTIYYVTNRFLCVRVPVWYFNQYNAFCIRPSPFYFLKEKFFYDCSLTLLIPLPVE